MNRKNLRRLLWSALTATLVVGAGVGPGRPFLLAASSTIYTAWLFAAYLFRSVPGAFWWTTVSLIVSILIVRTAIRSFLKHRPVPGLVSVWSVRRSGRQNGISRSPDRLNLIRRQLTEIGEHPSAKAFIDRELADILSRMLRGRRWTRGGASELADHPVLSTYPDLRRLAAEGPAIDGSPRHTGGWLFLNTRRRQLRCSEAIEQTEQYTQSLEAIADHREYQKHHE